MASKRDEAFEAFYQSLDDKGGIGGRDLIRKAWEAGRRYEAERIASLTARVKALEEKTDDIVVGPGGALYTR